MRSTGASFEQALRCRLLPDFDAVYNFFDGLDELYHHAMFGEDRTTRAGRLCAPLRIDS